jgi:hypothetical protein
MEGIHAFRWIALVSVMPVFLAALVVAEHETADDDFMVREIQDTVRCAVMEGNPATPQSHRGRSEERVLCCGHTGIFQFLWIPHGFLCFVLQGTIGCDNDEDIRSFHEVPVATCFDQLVPEFLVPNDMEVPGLEILDAWGESSELQELQHILFRHWFLIEVADTAAGLAEGFEVVIVHGGEVYSLLDSSHCTESPYPQGFLMTYFCSTAMLNKS